MMVSEILNSLDNSWKRNVILSKIKNGIDTDEIVNEFLINNEVLIKELNSLLKSEDIVLLNQVKRLLNCEAKLINKINNLENIETNHKTNEEEISLSNTFTDNKIISFMNNWSNKFVVIALLIISSLDLSKQAWA